MKNIRTTKALALEALYGTGEANPGLINELILLTQDDATTDQLKAAENKAELILRTLRIWSSSRHLIDAAPRRYAELITPKEKSA
jgi:hypothetical protein